MCVGDCIDSGRAIYYERHSVVCLPIRPVTVPNRPVTVPIRPVVISIRSVTVPIWSVTVPIRSVTVPIRSVVISIRSVAAGKKGLPGAGIMEADDRQVTTVFHSPTVIPPSALDKPSIMKSYHRRRTCSHTSPHHSPTMVTLHDTLFVECRWRNGGWTVKAVVT